MKFLIENWPFFAVGFVLAVLYIQVVLMPNVRRNQKKITYQSLAEPRLFWDNGEADYWERFRLERSRYIGSGNNIARVQVPLIPFPRDSKFEVKWFDKTHYVSTVGLRPDEYSIAGVRFLNKLKEEWDRELLSKFDMDILMRTKGQVFSEKDEESDLWENYKSEIKHN